MNQSHAQSKAGGDVANVRSTAQAIRLPPGPVPTDVVLIKAHSAGIGDLLASSAAWRVLRDALPESRFHLWFLSNHPGSPSEKLIGTHHPARQ